MRQTPQPRLGEVWSAVFDPATGHEQRGVRPALVISNDDFNQLPHTFCILVPLTRTNKDIPSHIPVHPPQGGLRETSFIMCEQEKSPSVTRLRRRMGSVDGATVDLVQATIARFIDR